MKMIMKEAYIAPCVNAVKLNGVDILTNSNLFGYDGDEIDAGGNMGGGVDLPSLPGLIDNN